MTAAYVSFGAEAAAPEGRLTNSFLSSRVLEGTRRAKLVESVRQGTNALGQAVLPLDSPVHYPRYNGAMEKHIGDLERLFPYALPECCAVELSAAQALVEAILLETNARPREALAGCSPTEFFHAAPDLHVDRRTRADIFESLVNATSRKVSAMRSPHLRCAATAWRTVVQQWLTHQKLISISTQTETNNHKQLLLPLSSKRWPRSLKIGTPTMSSTSRENRVIVARAVNWATSFG